MKFVCNYYQETQQLLDDRRIEIDYFKYPGLGFQMKLMENLTLFEDFCNRVTQKRPILLHGLYPAPHDLSSPTLQAEFGPDIADRLIAMTKTPGVSFHPALSDLSTEVPFKQTLATIICNAQFLKEKYDHMGFISIENCDTIEWGDLLKPQTITQLIHESGCRFLLDISHAYCASRLLDIPFFDYLKQLPMEKTVEIHINGWIETPSTVMCHTKINDSGYKALEFVLGYCNPDIITVEYGRHNDRIGAGVPVMTLEQTNERAKDEIVEQIDRVREICTRTNS